MKMSVAANSIDVNPHAPNRALNIALWVAQALLFAAFGMAGFMKATAPIDQLAKNMAWVSRFSPSTVRFIGVTEVCGALAMLLPSLTRIKPFLTPLAASGLLTIMVLAAGHHVTNGEAKLIPTHFILGGLAAFVAWGRWNKAPIAPR
jgi:putative oxidoreductase